MNRCQICVPQEVILTALKNIGYSLAGDTCVCGAEFSSKDNSIWLELEGEMKREVAIEFPTIQQLRETDSHLQELKNPIPTIRIIPLDEDGHPTDP